MADEPGASLRVRLLGTVDVRQGDEQLDLGSAHRRAVLAVLALRANYTVSREEIIDAIWGDAAPASAAGGVYTYVSDLRHVLEPTAGRASHDRILASGGGGYCLHISEDDVDALRFERLREQARQLRAAGDPAGERDVLRRALDLWHGAALAGVPGPYAHTQRVRLSELHLATVERHAALALDAGRHDDVLGELHTLAREHPVRESLHGLLIAALHRGGRPADALDAYRRLHTTLVEVSGTEPSPALRRLHDQIRDSAEPPPAVPRQRSRPDRSTLVGRGRERGVLHRAVERLAAGQGGCVWIEGEPGIGKSALLADALTDLPGWHVGRAVGDELAQRMPLSVLTECLDLRPGPAELRTAVEKFRTAATGHGGDDATASALDRAQMLVQQLCADAPVVLAVDDLQWADDASLLGWHHLQRLTRRLPLLLIAAARPDPQRRRLNLLRTVLADGGADMVTLPPLTAAESAAFVRAVAPERAGPELPEIAGELAAGNPHYLKAVVGAAVRGDVLPLGQHAAVGVSPLLAGTVAAHLELLTAETRDMVRAAAFLDGDCTVAEIAAITGRSIPELIPAVEESLAAGVLAESVGERLTFRHPLVQRVLHDGTPNALRLTLHREYAEKIAAGTGDPERVAALLLDGPAAPDEWAHRWIDANLDRLHRRDPELALRLLRHAAAHPGPDPHRRVQLTARAARLQLHAGLAAESDAAWVAAHTDDRALVAEMRWIVAVSHHRRGRHTAAAAVVRGALHDAATPARWRGRFAVLLTRVGPRAGRHAAPHRVRVRRDTGPAHRSGRTRRHGTRVLSCPG